jgi:hypothetical protein
MNFRTESFDLPQNEQRRCLSFDIGPLRRRGMGQVGASRGVVPRKVAPRTALRQVVRAGVTEGGTSSVRGLNTLSMIP